MKRFVLLLIISSLMLTACGEGVEEHQTNITYIDRPAQEGNVTVKEGEEISEASLNLPEYRVSKTERLPRIAGEKTRFYDHPEPSQKWQNAEELGCQTTLLYIIGDVEFCTDGEWSSKDSEDNCWKEVELASGKKYFCKTDNASYYPHPFFKDSYDLWIDSDEGIKLYYELFSSEELLNEEPSDLLVSFMERRSMTDEKGDYTTGEFNDALESYMYTTAHMGYLAKLMEERFANSEGYKDYTSLLVSRKASVKEAEEHESLSVASSSFNLEDFAREYIKNNPEMQKQIKESVEEDRKKQEEAKRQEEAKKRGEGWSDITGRLPWTEECALMESMGYSGWESYFQANHTSRLISSYIKEDTWTEQFLNGRIAEIHSTTEVCTVIWTCTGEYRNGFEEERIEAHGLTWEEHFID